MEKVPFRKSGHILSMELYEFHVISRGPYVTLFRRLYSNIVERCCYNSKEPRKEH